MPDKVTKLLEVIGRTSEGRRLFRNNLGGASSELSITVVLPGINNGRPTNIPSIFDGEILSEEDAIDRIIRSGIRDPETGRPLEGFRSIDEAIEAAKRRSASIRRVFNPGVEF